LINLRDEDAIASVAKVEVDESQDEGEDFENDPGEENLNEEETV